MESRRLPSRRAKRGDSPILSEQKIGISQPAKRVSPSRRPSHKVSPNQKLDSQVKMDVKKRGRATIKPQEELKDKSPVVLTKKLSVPILTPGTGQKLLKTSSSSSYSVKTTTSVRTVNLGGGNEADAEISRLTALGQNLLNRRSTSKIPTPLHHLTPTPTTEQSRQSHSVSRSVYEDEDNYSRTEYSDNEEAEDQYKSFQGLPTDHSITTKNIYSNIANVSSSSRKVHAPREFGGIIGITLLLLIVPIFSYYLQWCCSKSSKCEFKKINLNGWNLKYMEKVFDLQTISFYIVFQVTILFLSSFPLGRVICLRYDRGILEYYFNSLTVGVLTIVGFLVGEFYLKYPISDYISKHYLRFCIFGILNAIIGSFWFYIMSIMQAKWSNDSVISEKLQNPYGKSGNFLIDYCLGRDINPKWCGFVDIKLSHYRISLISMLTIGIMLILKNLNIPNLATGEEKLENYIDIIKYFYNNTGVIDQSALFCSILFLIYTLDLIVFEHHLASSFELQHEGVGALLLLRYAVTPYFLASLPKYALEHKSLGLPTWAICTISLIFIIGLLMKRAANGIKYKFRMNPNLPQFQYRETVPTFQGRRLLCHHLWSLVRQPNYTGDIITLLTMLSPIYWKLSYPPICCYLLLILLLVHRTVRVNARNFDRYSSAWTRYCTKVRHIIIPKVF